MARQPASEILWSSGTDICSLEVRNGLYEVHLSRDGGLACLLTVDPEDAARLLAHKWLIAAQDRREDR